MAEGQSGEQALSAFYRNAYLDVADRTKEEFYSQLETTRLTLSRVIPNSRFRWENKDVNSIIVPEFESVCQHLKSADINNPVACYNAAVSSYVVGRLVDAYLCFARAHKLFENNEDKSDASCYIGTIFMTTRLFPFDDHVLAEAFQRRAIAENSTNKVALVNLSSVYMCIKDFEKARQLLDRAQELDSDYEELKLNLNNFHLFESGEAFVEPELDSITKIKRETEIAQLNSFNRMMLEHVVANETTSFARVCGGGYRAERYYIAESLGLAFHETEGGIEVLPKDKIPQVFGIEELLKRGETGLSEDGKTIQ